MPKKNRNKKSVFMICSVSFLSMWSFPAIHHRPVDMVFSGMFRAGIQAVPSPHSHCFLSKTAKIITFTIVCFQSLFKVRNPKRLLCCQFSLLDSLLQICLETPLKHWKTLWMMVCSLFTVKLLTERKSVL